MSLNIKFNTSALTNPPTFNSYRELCLPWYRSRHGPSVLRGQWLWNTEKESHEGCAVPILILRTSSPCCAITLGLWLAPCKLSVMGLVSKSQLPLPGVPAPGHQHVPWASFFSRSTTDEVLLEMLSFEISFFWRAEDSPTNIFREGKIWIGITGG